MPTSIASPWAPLRIPAYRSMWLMWLLSNTCMWMGNVAAAWMMALLPVPPIWVALVQAATSLPVLLLTLPFGTLADMVNRRCLLLITQAWLGCTALLQGALAFTGALSAPVLLLMTFAYGCGFAMRLPVYSASVVALVPREMLPAALALNTASMHASRIAGPLLTGLLLVVAGPPFVFAVVALISLLCLALVWRWRPAEAPSARAAGGSFRETLLAGIQFVFHSASLKGLLARVSLFFATTSALPALLPLVALQTQGAGARTFPLLMAALGTGAMIAMLFLPHLRARYSRDRMVFASVSAHAAAMVVVAMTHSSIIAGIAMCIAGASMMSATNSLNIAAQLYLPDWVRARGMAIHQIALLGSGAIGAALWGQVATLTDVRTSLMIAAAAAVVGMALTMRAMPAGNSAN